jgi:hypothetical protein
MLYVSAVQRKISLRVLLLVLYASWIFCAYNVDVHWDACVKHTCRSHPKRMFKYTIFRISCLYLPPVFVLLPCYAYSSVLKMQATCSSETSVDFQRTTLCCIPEDRIFLTTAVRTSNATYYYLVYVVYEALFQGNGGSGIENRN